MQTSNEMTSELKQSANATSRKARSVVALAGGVGAARFLKGVMQVHPQDDLCVIVNTGDDATFYGVQVCPDLDIITYTLSGQIDRTHGYGLEGDRFELLRTLEALGHDTWFRLGDRDYANCLHRTLQRQAGKSLRDVSASLTEAFGLDIELLPMSEAPCPTFIELNDGRRMHFENYLIQERSPASVRAIDLSAAQQAKPGDGIVEALEQAQTILICPSNPAVSIGPILAIPGVREAISASGAPVVAVSPIIAGAPVKGPAHHLLPALGVPVSALGVARLYQGWVDGFVLDNLDAALAPQIEALGMQAAVCDTLMNKPGVDSQLAKTSLTLAASLRNSTDDRQPSLKPSS